MDDDTRAGDCATPAPERTDYTLTIEGRVLGSVVVGSTSAIKAGKWLRDVAMPNDLVFISPVKWDWTTAKATWDGDEPEPAKPPPAGLGIDVVSGASLTITVTDIPLLPTEPAARVAAIQAHAEDFGRATVEAGFNRAEDMPPSDNYVAASATVANMLTEGSISLALLVNLVAALDTHKANEARS